MFYRTKVGSQNSRNSRIDNILKMWGLENRLVLNDASLSDFAEKPISYSEVNDRIDEKRKESISYLLTALSDCK